MKSDEDSVSAKKPKGGAAGDPSGAAGLLGGSIGPSIDMLVEYLVDNDIEGIHPLIMGEVERRLIIKALERSRGNKVRAAKILGISRNTFHRKIRRIEGLSDDRKGKK